LLLRRAGEAGADELGQHQYRRDGQLGRRMRQAAANMAGDDAAAEERAKRDGQDAEKEPLPAAAIANCRVLPAIAATRVPPR
jgi:hypothetical protein